MSTKQGVKLNVTHENKIKLELSIHNFASFALSTNDFDVSDYRKD